MEEKAAQEELEILYDAITDSWIRALSLKDYETAGRCERVAQMAVFLAKELGVPEKDIVTIRRGALLHDIGKLGIPDAILLKKEPLTEEEFRKIQQHIHYARQILSPLPFFKSIMDMVVSHHERWDGEGYPQRLKGEAIPQYAQIIAVAGMWDALLSDRPYRPALPEEKAIQIMREQRGKMFSPTIVDTFLKIIDGSSQS